MSGDEMAFDIQLSGDEELNFDLTTSFPKISVIMGVYYRRKDTFMLERSVQSILNQTEKNFEFLICDDGSSEEARLCLQEFVRRDKRIRLICAEGAYSLPEKLNACLVNAKGCWIARMDDDDYSHPRRFEVQIQYLREHPELAFVGCNVNLCCENSVVGQRNFPERPQVYDFYFTQPYIHPALMFRSHVLRKIKGYSEKPYCILCEDYDLLLRLYTEGYQGGNIQETLFDYTIPITAKGKRTMKHRWNECVTRYHRFRDLGVLSEAFPYVIKPLVVGIMPEFVLRRIKRLKNKEKPL